MHGTIAVRSKYFLSSSREEGGDVRLANIADPSRHSFVTEHTLHRTVHHYMVQGRTDPIRVLAYKGLAMCVWCKYSLDFYRKYEMKATRRPWAGVWYLTLVTWTVTWTVTLTVTSTR